MTWTVAFSQGTISPLNQINFVVVIGIAYLSTILNNYLLALLFFGVLLPVAQQRQFKAVPQRLPARGNYVLRAAHRAPAFLAPRRLDYYSRFGRRAQVLVHDAHFVIDQVHVRKLGIVGQQSL